MPEQLTDRDLRDFAVGLRDDLEEQVLSDERHLDRLAAIWSEDHSDIDVHDPVVQALKASRFAAHAIGLTGAAFMRIATGLQALASGRTDRP